MIRNTPVEEIDFNSDLYTSKVIRIRATNDGYTVMLHNGDNLLISENMKYYLDNKYGNLVDKEIKYMEIGFYKAIIQIDNGEIIIDDD